VKHGVENEKNGQHSNWSNNHHARLVECPAVFVSAAMRETGMKGAGRFRSRLPEFLNYVRDGHTIDVTEDGTVTVH
jgi:hypothetical protein